MIFLKCFKSALICQGIRPFLAIPSLSSWATMRESSADMLKTADDGDFSLNRRVGVVACDFKVLKFKVVDGFDFRINFNFRERPGFSFEL